MLACTTPAIPSAAVEMPSTSSNRILVISVVRARHGERRAGARLRGREPDQEAIRTTRALAHDSSLCSVEGVDPDRLEIAVGERVLRLVVVGVAVDLDRPLRDDDFPCERKRCVVAPAVRRELARLREGASAGDELALGV